MPAGPESAANRPQPHPAIAPGADGRPVDLASLALLRQPLSEQSRLASIYGRHDATLRESGLAANVAKLHNARPETTNPVQIDDNTKFRVMVRETLPIPGLNTLVVSIGYEKKDRTLDIIDVGELIEADRLYAKSWPYPEVMTKESFEPVAALATEFVDEYPLFVKKYTPDLIDEVPTAEPTDITSAERFMGMSLLEKLHHVSLLQQLGGGDSERTGIALVEALASADPESEGIRIIRSDYRKPQRNEDSTFDRYGITVEFAEEDGRTVHVDGSRKLLVDTLDRAQDVNGLSRDRLYEFVDQRMDNAKPQLESVVNLYNRSLRSIGDDERTVDEQVEDVLLAATRARMTYPHLARRLIDIKIEEDKLRGNKWETVYMWPLKEPDSVGIFLPRDPGEVDSDVGLSSNPRTIRLDEISAAKRGQIVTLIERLRPHVQQPEPQEMAA